MRTHTCRRLVPLVVAIAAAGVGVAATPRPGRAQATITVSTAVDEDVDNGVCSLREAIIAANTNASYHGCAAANAGVNDTIQFALGAGTPTINISTTPLPTITQWVTINGGAARVELHGPGAPWVSGKHGLTVSQWALGRSSATWSSTTSPTTASASRETRCTSTAATSAPTTPA